MSFSQTQYDELVYKCVWLNVNQNRSILGLCCVKVALLFMMQKLQSQLELLMLLHNISLCWWTTKHHNFSEVKKVKWDVVTTLTCGFRKSCLVQGCNYNTFSNCNWKCFHGKLPNWVQTPKHQRFEIEIGYNIIICVY